MRTETHYLPSGLTAHREARMIAKWGKTDTVKAQSAVLKVLDNKTDSRARLRAASRILDDQWMQYEHANPPVQQLEITTRVSNISAAFAKIILKYVPVDKRGECSAEMRRVLAE